VVGSPKTVREQLLDGIKELRMGHLLALLHFGSMPTALCKRNIDLFAREVLPYLADQWTTHTKTAGGPSAEEKARRCPRHGCRVLTRETGHGERGNTQAETLAGPHRDRGRDRGQKRAAAGLSARPLGLGPDRAFVARLAAQNTVYAPKFPAPAAAIPRRRNALDSWLDLSSITANCSTRSSSRRPRLSAIPSAACLPPKSPPPRRNRSAAWR